MSRLVSYQQAIDNHHNVIYKLHMIEIRSTEIFDRWMRKLRDPNARARIQIRIDRLQRGLFGDVKDIGQGLSELRIDYGPGYRVYLMKRGDVLLILLCGGDKRSQDGDIKQAKALADEWKRSDS
jgi:putative addiction module killer protein